VPARAEFPWRLATISCAALALLAVLVLSLGAGWAWLNGQVANNTPQPKGEATLAVPLFQPSVTLAHASPTSIPTRLPSFTATVPLLPVDNGPTITAWPTLTVTPSPMITETPTLTAAPGQTLAVK